MRSALFATLLFSLGLGGCIGTPLSPAAAEDLPTTAEARAPLEVGLAAISGEFLIATQVPSVEARCEGAGTIFTPTPQEGTWHEVSLPVGAFAIRAELTEEGPPELGIGYRVCVFAEDEFLEAFTGLAPLAIDVDGLSTGALMVLVVPDGGAGVLVNEGVKVAWTIEGVAVTAPRASA